MIWREDSMEREAYIRVISKEVNKILSKQKLLLQISIGCVLLAFALMQIVRHDFLGVGSRQALDYMLNTNFYSFSATELKIMLFKSINSYSNLPMLLFIYWGYNALAVSFSFCFIIIMIYQMLKIKGYDYKRGLYYTNRIMRELHSYINERSVVKRYRLYRLLLSWRLYHTVSPLRSYWFENKTQQWFSLLDIPRDAKVICAALSQFPKSIRYAISSRIDLRPYFNPFEYLEKFFWSIAERTDSRLGKSEKSQKRVRLRELELLKNFSQEARPLIISAYRDFRASVSEGLRSIIKEYTIRLSGNRLIRVAVTLGIIAAAIMLIGVMVFKIDAKQAFITWFAVMFGSLTLSIGVTSRFGKGDKESEMRHNGIDLGS